MNKPADRAAVDAEIQRLLELRHPDPHHVLGIHPADGAVVIRAFRPGAASIHAVPDSGGRIPLEHLRGGVFEAYVLGRGEVFPYRLEVKYPDGNTFTFRDPYSFTPTLGEMDLYFAGEGRHQRLWEKMGAHLIHHQGQSGVSFAVWAPMADGVSVVGDFNSWDGRLHLMRSLGASGIWELFAPDLGEGARYKFEIRPKSGPLPFLKADPFAFRTEPPPATASVVHDLHHYRWSDEQWMRSRAGGDVYKKPISIYEVHLASWRRVIEDGNRPMTYRELAPALADYVTRMGFTHVELLPVAEHPFGGSWGYQVSSYFSPTARHGHPDDLRFLIDTLHQHGIGVLVDWVPAHFPKDAHALARFDGSALYEHEDPRKGYHPDWGTLVFNYGRNEVKNFLIANALFWLDEYHVDGLRVDAVASMLYLDYSRRPGEWIPNRWGGRENEEAIAFMRELNGLVRHSHPGVLMIAEESTAWPRVTVPPSEGGLGFHLKWNMGWMHDVLEYFQTDSIFRQYHHNKMTFAMWYAYSEHFILPLSHDEVVHMKRSLLEKMPGDRWRKLAGLRALLAWMWSHPGRKLLFMGGELAQEREWNHDQSLDWHLLERSEHRGVQELVQSLNALYRREPALHESDSEPYGLQWLQPDAASVNVYAFIRRARSTPRPVICVANLSPVPRNNYRIGLPEPGSYVELLNTDATAFGGSGVGNPGRVVAEAKPWDAQPTSAEITLPPLGVVWLSPASPEASEEEDGRAPERRP